MHSSISFILVLQWLIIQLINGRYHMHTGTDIFQQQKLFFYHISDRCFTIYWTRLYLRPIHFTIYEASRFLCVYEEQDTGKCMIQYWAVWKTDAIAHSSWNAIFFLFFFFNFILFLKCWNKKNFKRKISVIEWKRSAEIHSDLFPHMTVSMGERAQRSY